MGELDVRAEIRAFLISRRARVHPTERELLRSTRPRRVAGLRREEVATRAAISLDYYVQLERGQLRGVSDAVLASLIEALELDTVERTYLLNLVAQANRSPTTPTPVVTSVRPELQAMVDRMTDIAVIIRNYRLDLLGGNARGLALFAAVRRMPDHNIARHVFLDPASRDFYPDFDEVADSASGTLRASLGRDLADDDLVALVDELLASPDFAARWNRQHVQRFGAGTQRFAHPRVGHLQLFHEQLGVVVDPGLTLTVYRPVPGTGSDAGFEALAEVASNPNPGSAGG